MEKFFNKHSSYQYSDKEAVMEMIKKLKEAKSKLDMNPDDQSVLYDLAQVDEMLHDYFEELKVNPKEMQKTMKYDPNPYVTKPTVGYDGTPKSHFPGIFPIFPIFPSPYPRYPRYPQWGNPWQNPWQNPWHSPWHNPWRNENDEMYPKPGYPRPGYPMPEYPTPRPTYPGYPQEPNYPSYPKDPNPKPGY